MHRIVITRVSDAWWIGLGVGVLLGLVVGLLGGVVLGGA